MNKAELLQKCTDLGIDISGLDTNAKLKAAIEAKEAELEALEVETEKAAAEKAAAEKAEAEKAAAEKAEAEKAAAEKAEAEKAAAEKAAAEKAEKEVPVYTDEKGRKWSFKATAPKKINIDGHSMSQEEIFEDEDIISELIYGNSTLLIQKSK